MAEELYSTSCKFQRQNYRIQKTPSQATCVKENVLSLNVTDKLVSYSLQKNESHRTSAGFSIADQRGRHKPHNKTPEDLLCGVWKYISSFLTMAPHYCRAVDTNRKFLGADLNIIQMIRKVQG